MSPREKWKQWRSAYGANGPVVALLNRVVPWPVVAHVKPEFAAHQVLLRTRTADLWTYEQVFLDCEYDLPLPFAPRVIVDCGAHIGYASAYFAQRYPEAKIVAVEPDAANFELLRKNTTDDARVLPVHAAIWNVDGSIEMIDPGHGTWGYRTGAATGDGARPRVPALTLASLMDRYELDCIDLLKVDIEGAECELFSDPSAWIMRVRAMVVELHDRFRPGCTEALRNAVRIGGFTHELQRGEHHAYCRAADLEGFAAEFWRPIPLHA